MNNLELSTFLSDLATLTKANKISQDQVVKLINEKLNAKTTSPTVVNTPQPQKAGLRSEIKSQHIFYGVGAIVVIIGIVFLVGQIWSDLNVFIKVAITLGPAISAYSLGYYMHKHVSRALASAFFMISAAIFPLGVGMVINALGFVDSLAAEGLLLNFVILMTIATASYYSLKEDVFIPLSISSATGTYFTATYILFRNITVIDHFGEYTMIALGISYILIGYYLRAKNIMSNLLYSAGIIFILSMMILLQGFNDIKPESIIWTFIHTITLAVFFYLSIKLQSRLLLFISTLFTIIQILKFTGEFFAESIGWTVSLIVAGLIIIGIGYLSFEVNKKYIKSSLKSTTTNP
ncbi:MAG: DUF2157 domain-containing protein [Candidatus Levybacteria bacterium]|nr:DUF2157 domain-containing protein [Candidatus Levybacteria bacterium]